MDTEKIQNRSFTINLKLTDGDDYLLKIHHGVLLYYKDALSDEADLTISTPESGFLPSQAEIRKISTSSSPLKRAIRRCSKRFVTVWPLLTCISISSSRKKNRYRREKDEENHSDSALHGDAAVRLRMECQGGGCLVLRRCGKPLRRLTFTHSRCC